MVDFSYIIDRIQEAHLEKTPFEHVYLENIFTKEHFEQIRTASEINISEARDDEELIRHLEGVGYKIISFPGCITDGRKYVNWHKSKKKTHENPDFLEGFGLVFRLYEPSSSIIADLKTFISSAEFNGAIKRKFNIEAEVSFDNGIQKYLDGYEISPHCDTRRKAATFMVNINPSPLSEEMDHHTHYLKFTKPREYVRSFWENNPDYDRCWVPWSWAEIVKTQTKNNSMVLFAPSNNTLHAVKARYDHLKTQRTQLYGNLWFTDEKPMQGTEWEQHDLIANIERSQPPSTNVLVRSMRFASRIFYGKTSVGNRVRKSL